MKDWLKKVFCRHRNTKRMTFGDYGYGDDICKTNEYVLTICQDCGKILHGRWMGGKAPE